MTITKIDHARILNAYLSRMTLADMQNLMQAKERWIHATMNYSNSQQLQAQAGFYAAVCNSVNNLIAHDLHNIEIVMELEIGE
jgi:predicted RNA-binding protein with PIN domain